jgi:acyl carrier protein|tara:strand:+ start:33 stop:281 length:249 start_codon:yes stop_codon:yes gene_type:complete
MSNKEIIESIKEIVIDVLDIEDQNNFKLDELSKIEDYSEWDSLAHINIITQIESIFNIRFSLDEVENFVDIQDIINVVNSRI